MKESLKVKLIETARDMIEEMGAENIRVRDLAKRVNCSAPAVYKHFESFDDLLIMASLRFLQPYIKELNKNLNETQDLIEAIINSWKIFNKYAFAYPYIFLALFWNKDSESLESALFDYFELYPLERVASDDAALFYFSLCSGNIEERDYVWLRHIATKGLMKQEDAKHVSTINCLIARALLQEHLYDYRDPEIYRQAVEKCNALIERNIRMCLL